MRARSTTQPPALPRRPRPRLPHPPKSPALAATRARSPPDRSARPRPNPRRATRQEVIRQKVAQRQEYPPAETTTHAARTASPLTGETRSGAGGIRGLCRPAPTVGGGGPSPPHPPAADEGTHRSSHDDPWCRRPSAANAGPAEEKDMTDTAHTGSDSSSATYASDGPEVTGWAGWVAFAGIMMVVLGLFQAIEGLVGIFDDGYYLVRPSGLVVNVDYTVWGWTHLIVGLIAIAAGIGLLTGNMLARIVGIAIAVISA